MCNFECDVVRSSVVGQEKCASIAPYLPVEATNAREMLLRNEYCQTTVRKDPPLKAGLRHFRNDTLATVGVLAFVLTVLVSVDERVREQARLAMSPGAVGSIGTRFGEVGSALLEAARYQSVEHAPMMIFIVVGTILLLCMMRA